MDLGIKGKTALVTGASSGLGKAIAQQLVENGVKTVICARNKEKLNNAAEEIGAIAVCGDLSSPQDLKRILSEANDILGGIDILVANTGGPPKAQFVDTTEEMWGDAFQSLFLSTTEAIRQVLPGMIDKQWGRIIINASISAKEPINDLILSNSLQFDKIRSPRLV
ncbi:MAG: SDR family NAD(P)-dependent oxidoreductase [Lentisphaeraceae bacterium]|nr:SDR family NAD(P)-dependent oxidoreductase [Lentisphaeraceae bacterium]